MKQKHYDWTDVHHFQFHCNWMVNKSSDVALFIIESNALSHALQVKMVRLYVTSVEWNVFNQNYNFLVNDSWSFIINGERERKQRKKKYIWYKMSALKRNKWNCMHSLLMALSRTVRPEEVNYVWTAEAHAHTHREREREFSLFRFGLAWCALMLT